MQLKIASKNVDGILVIECSGRIVFGEESSLVREQVKQAIPDNKRIVLNLGEVNYIDSGGLGTLVALHTTAQCRIHHQAGEPYETRWGFAAGDQTADGVRRVQLGRRSDRIVPQSGLA